MRAWSSSWLLVIRLVGKVLHQPFPAVQAEAAVTAGVQAEGDELPLAHGWSSHTAL